VVKGLSSPAKETAVTRNFPIDPAVHERGAQVYGNTCVACHGLDGFGVAGAFPPLAGSEWVTGDASVPTKIVLHGLMGPISVDGVEFNSAMPPLVGLSEEDIASVVTYVRQHFGNDASPVTEDDVRAVRRQTGWGAREMWTAETLGMMNPEAAP
jgi:mono/diheme cytochrome c family protein